MSDHGPRRTEFPTLPGTTSGCLRGRYYGSLPTATELLQAFGGAVVPSTLYPEIMRAVQDLMAAHRRCADSDRVLRAWIADENHDGHQWQAAVSAWLTACDTIATAVAVIDAQVDAQVDARRGATASPRSGIPVVTESVGQVISRMARLWTVIDAHGLHTGPVPETAQLAGLCQGYADLIDGLATGTLQLCEP